MSSTSHGRDREYKSLGRVHVLRFPSYIRCETTWSCAVDQPSAVSHKCPCALAGAKYVFNFQVGLFSQCWWRLRMAAQCQCPASGKMQPRTRQSASRQGALIAPIAPANGTAQAGLTSRAGGWGRAVALRQLDCRVLSDPTEIARGQPSR
jgi:hypothetical protein